MGIHLTYFDTLQKYKYFLYFAMQFNYLLLHNMQTKFYGRSKGCLKRSLSYQEIEDENQSIN